MKPIDLNCDMGEGCPNDAELMNYVSSVNIACGYHAGDATTMRTTAELANEKNIAIGAHPSFPDRENFGRTAMIMTPREVYDIVTFQIAALNDICHASGIVLSHVKPHGALYNQSARDTKLAAAIAEAVRDTNPLLVLFGLSGSVSIIEAERLGLRTASEVFADRTYQRNGSLTPRSEPNAMISDVDLAAAQALSMVRDGAVIAVDGVSTPVRAETICIHGDGEHAVRFAGAVRGKLSEFGFTIMPVH